MKYFYNPHYGVILYPQNWFDALRCFFVWLIIPKFTRVWQGNPYWKTKAVVAGAIVKELEETKYPDLVSGG